MTVMTGAARWRPEPLPVQEVEVFDTDKHTYVVDGDYDKLYRVDAAGEMREYEPSAYEERTVRDIAADAKYSAQTSSTSDGGWRHAIVFGTDVTVGWFVDEEAAAAAVRRLRVLPQP